MSELQPDQPQTFWEFDEKRTGSHRYLAPHLLRLCQQYGADRILDIGCGNGWFARDLSDGGFRTVVGLEPSESGIRHARQLAPEAEFHRFSVYDADSIETGRFDIAISAEVIEHLYHPRTLVDLAWRTLRDGGIFIVTTPYHGWLKNVLIAAAGKWDHHHQPWGEGSHIKFWSRPSLTAFLEARGFIVVEFVGVERVRWLWKSMILVARKNRPPVNP